MNVKSQIVTKPSRAKGAHAAPAMINRVRGLAGNHTMSTRALVGGMPVHSYSHARIQPKLTVNAPGDLFEQEADTVAERVMRMPEPTLQRACACGGGCPQCLDEQDTHERLQKKSVQANDSVSTAVPPVVHEVLRSSGQPLDRSTREFMEPRFGRDFSQVRVHTGALAAKSARAVNALAYTVGRNIVFADGQHAPSTSRGKQLFAHELSHVLQQNFSAAHTSRALRVEHGDAPSEREADSLSQMVTASTAETTVHPRTAPLSVQRECDKTTGKWIPVSDGCTVPRIAVRLLGGLDRDNPARGKDTDFAHEDKKTGPCDKHDLCYQTPSTGPGARDRCDTQFLKDMIAVCSASKDPAHKSDCYRTAWAYYQGVRAIGLFFFGRDQKDIRRCKVRAEGLETSSTKTASDSQKTDGASGEKKVVTQPPAQTIPSVKLEEEPVKVTSKVGFEAERSKTTSTQSLNTGTEVEKEGFGSVGVSRGDKRTTEVNPQGVPESSTSVEYQVEANLPVGSWIFSESLSKRIAPLVFLNEVRVGGGFATKHPDDPLKLAATNLATDLSISLIGVEVKKQEVPLGLLDWKVGASALGGVEKEREGGPWKTSYQVGGEVKGEAQYWLKGGPAFIFVEGSAKLSTNKDGSANWTPGAFTFTATAGFGITLPVVGKKAKRQP